MIAFDALETEMIEILIEFIDRNEKLFSKEVRLKVAELRATLIKMRIKGAI